MVALVYYMIAIPAVLTVCGLISGVLEICTSKKEENNNFTINGFKEAF
jgi:hypothetical protein